MHRHAFEWHADMLADEAPGLRYDFRFAVEVQGRVGKLPASLAGIGKECTDAALDVDPRISPCRACGLRQLVKLLLALRQILAKRFELVRPLMEG